MGMDLLDIRFRVERELDVKVSHDDWSSLVDGSDVTVGALFGLLLARKHLSDTIRQDMLMNEAVWLEVRRAISTVVGRQKNDVTLQSSLSDLFPAERRKELWTRLKAESIYRPPRLVLSDKNKRRLHFWNSFVALVAVLPIPVATTISKWKKVIVWPEILVGIAAAVVWVSFVLLIRWSTVGRQFDRRRDQFPGAVATVKDLCQLIRDSNSHFLVNSHLDALQQEGVTAWQKLRTALVNALGVEDDEVTMNARIIRDLGAS